jgi:hypothetical protein
MNAKTGHEVQDIATLRLPDLQRYLSVGKGSAIKIGEISGARFQVGRMVLYKRSVIDAWVEKQK